MEELYIVASAARVRFVYVFVRDFHFMGLNSHFG